MKAVSFRALALASLASLAMATSSSAVTILQFGQVNPTISSRRRRLGSDHDVNHEFLGGSRFDPHDRSRTSAGLPCAATPILAFETFTDVVSTGTATTTGWHDRPAVQRDDRDHLGAGRYRW